MSVSVVIPAYNRAHRLPAALDSVLRQTRPADEIIVVDDGSVDDTRGVVQQYGGAVTYVYQANAGVGAARNTGIRAAGREFVAFLDSDDRWEPSKLDLQLSLLRQRADVGLVFSDFLIERADGTTVPHGAATWAGRALDFPEMSQLELHPAGDQSAATAPVLCWVGPMYRQLLNELPILTSSVTVRRSALDADAWYTEHVALFEDWEFFARVARRSSVGYITQPTTVNVGHRDPGRVSKCSNLDRADSYRTLLERVWLADAAFMASHGAEARTAYGHALLAVAREALLAGRHDRARGAIETWRRIGADDRRAWAALYAVCSQIPMGTEVLRNVLRGRALARQITGAGKRTYGSVNPAA